ncbi:BnaAnng25470D [Brassica napus]|nr:BnaAnng25470D [Brassica napus]
MVFNLSDTKVIVMCHPKVAKEILNSSQIKRSEEQRRMVVTQMVNAFTLNVGTVFEVRDLLKTASLCNMMGLVFGKEYELETNNNVESEYLKGLVEEWYDAELDPIIFLD